MTTPAQDLPHSMKFLCCFPPECVAKGSCFLSGGLWGDVARVCKRLRASESVRSCSLALCGKSVSLGARAPRVRGAWNCGTWRLAGHRFGQAEGMAASGRLTQRVWPMTVRVAERSERLRTVASPGHTL